MEHNQSGHEVKKRKSVLMSNINFSEHEIELYDQLEKVKAAYRKKMHLPEDEIAMILYESNDSRVFMYIFDQESYQKFKDHVSTIPQSIPVRIRYH